MVVVVIKIERAGCPPFWRKDFRSLQNVLEFGRHATDFVTTRFVQTAGKKKNSPSYSIPSCSDEHPSLNNLVQLLFWCPSKFCDQATTDPLE